MTERSYPAYVRQLASELELLSHGSSTAWGSAGGQGIPDSRPPSGETRPPHVQCLTDWDRRGDACLPHWLDVLKQWKGGGKARPLGLSEREIVLDAGEGHSADDVAVRYRLTPTMVRKWRLEDGRNVNTGRRVSVAGKTQQQAADALGVSQPTMSRLRRAA